MQSRIFKISTLLCAFAVAILVSSCKRKVDPRNQITVTINSVDKDTEENRVNMFDTIDVRVWRLGILKKRSVKVAQYITDYRGLVRVKFDKSEDYHIILHGKNSYGSRDFCQGELKDGQEVNVEVISLENR